MAHRVRDTHDSSAENTLCRRPRFGLMEALSPQHDGSCFCYYESSLLAAMVSVRSFSGCSNRAVMHIDNFPTRSNTTRRVGSTLPPPQRPLSQGSGRPASRQSSQPRRPAKAPYLLLYFLNNSSHHLLYYKYLFYFSAHLSVCLSVCATRIQAPQGLESWVLVITLLPGPGVSGTYRWSANDHSTRKGGGTALVCVSTLL